MDSATEELIRTVSQLAELLEGDGDRRWSSWIRRVESRLKKSDYSGLGYLLSAYGGMGSFNDLVLGQSQNAGKYAWKNGHVELNERFDALRSRAWDLAHHIQKQRDARA